MYKTVYTLLLYDTFLRKRDKSFSRQKILFRYSIGDIQSSVYLKHICSMILINTHDRQDDMV